MRNQNPASSHSGLAQHARPPVRQVSNVMEVPRQSPSLADRIDPQFALPILMAQVLSTGRAARVICDSGLSVLWFNSQFERMTGATPALRIERGMLRFQRRAQQAQLQNFALDQAAEDLVLFAGEDDEPHRFAIQALKLNCPISGSCCALKIVAGADNIPDNHRHFDRHFKLTPQETAICRELLKGHTVVQIAQQKACATETVRFHVQNIYRKLDVSSREMMFARLRVFQMD